MQTRILLGFCASVIAACGGSSSNGGGGSAAVNGTAGGKPVPTTETIGLVGTQSQVVGTTTISVAYAGAFITNVANSCGELQRQGNPASTSSLSFIVARPGTSVPTGTYTIGGANAGTVSSNYTTSTATCGPDKSEQATAGSITFTTVSTTTVQGTFDVTMNSGDHLTGSFAAPVCNTALPTTASTKPCGS